MEFRQGENEIMEIVIFGFCVFGCGVTSYFIGHKASVKLGAGLMFDTLYKMGKENPDNPGVVELETEKMDEQFNRQ